jgi:hypothetical protein
MVQTDISDSLMNDSVPEWVTSEPGKHVEMSRLWSPIQYTVLARTITSSKLVDSKRSILKCNKGGMILFSYEELTTRWTKNWETIRTIAHSIYLIIVSRLPGTGGSTSPRLPALYILVYDSPRGAAEIIAQSYCFT